jgi:multidrug efflux pump subunit AcrB
VRIAPQSARLDALGISAGDLGDAVSAHTQGAVAAQIPGESATIPVIVRVAGAFSASGIGGSTLFTKNGPAPLGAFARIDEPPRASEITEENSRLIDRVTANIGDASLSAVIGGVKTALAQAGLPPGYTAAIGGAYETQQASFREFSSVIGIAIALVFSVMLATFGSFRLPLVILCAIPLALIGVAAALFVTRTPINVSSFMGLLLLVGIVVKNGILLIDVANRRRAAGDDVTTALLRAGSTRVRPIVMTALAAIGGLFPLALGLGAGAEMERPLAIAVIGGLSTATLFTLVLIPVLYATFSGGLVRHPALQRGPAALLLALLLCMPRAASAQAAPPAGPAPRWRKRVRPTASPWSAATPKRPRALSAARSHSD